MRFTHGAGAAVICGALAGGLLGCGAAEDEGAGPVTIGSGEITLAFVPGTGLVESRGGERLVTLPVDGFVLGRVDEVSDAVNYDPYPLASEARVYNPPEGLRFLAATRAKLTSRSASSVTLALSFPEGQTATVEARETAAGSFALRFTPSDDATGVAYLRLRPLVAREEAFYGLGESFDDVNQRGKVRAMQLEVDGSFESANNEAHVPIPFLIGTGGWGLFVDDPHPAAFDVAAKEEDRVEATWGLGLASSSGLAFHLFGAAHPLDVTRHYYELTGYPKLPARWALGPWVWRNENDDQAQVLGDLSTMRDLDLPATGYWIDRPYATAVNTFDFNPAQFPDAPAMLDELHGLGFHTALWHTPYLDEKSPEGALATQALRDEASAKGYYPPVTGLLVNKWGRPIDLTNPDAFAWWQSLISKYTKMGVAGFKLDYGEDVVPGIFGARNEWKFFDGSDERTMHQLFQRSYHAAYAELLPEDGDFLLCRHSTAGDQTRGVIIWPGDLDASFARHGEPLPGGSRAVGGLPASMIAGLTLGPSGFPFYASDTGGYRDAPPDKELFTRWFEQTALGSVMEIGTNSNDVAWEPTPENGFDAEMLGWYRRYTSLHLRLWPYAWTYAANLAKDGRPLQRPLGLVYPELGEHPWDEYLFGDDLLVAPVLERAQRERSVLFPPGTWIDWWDGSVHDGDRREIVAAPLDKLPLYLRSGGIVPLLRPTIETLAPTTAPDRVDSYATTPGVIYARVFPGGASTFTLFDGAELAQTLDGDTLVLESRAGAEFEYGVLWEVLGVIRKPATVSRGAEAGSLAELEAAASGWYHDGRSLFVKVGPGEATVDISL